MKDSLLNSVKMIIKTMGTFRNEHTTSKGLPEKTVKTDSPDSPFHYACISFVGPIIGGTANPA